jgi:hypothetical protein
MSTGTTAERGGVLTTRDCVTLARPLLRAELGILAGLLAMALRVHSGRRVTIEPARLAPPDSSLARDARGGRRRPACTGAAQPLASCVRLGGGHCPTRWDLV